MTCGQLRDEYDLFALGFAGGDEASELREHLGRGCEACSAGVSSARSLLATLAAAVPAMSPRPHLRARILASVGALEPRGFGWIPLWIAVSALSTVTAFYFYGRDRDNALQTGKFQRQAREQAIELTQLHEALEILNQPDTRQVIFGGGAAQPPRGRVFVNPKSGVLLVASNLPPAPAGRIYEMWLIPKRGSPMAAGLFQSGALATALHMQKVEVDVAATKAVAVTLEPEGGVAQPTSQPVIVAELSD